MIVSFLNTFGITPGGAFHKNVFKIENNVSFVFLEIVTIVSCGLGILDGDAALGKLYTCIITLNLRVNFSLESCTVVLQQSLSELRRRTAAADGRARSSGPSAAPRGRTECASASPASPEPASAHTCRH